MKEELSAEEVAAAAKLVRILDGLTKEQRDTVIAWLRFIHLQEKPSDLKPN